MNREEFVSGGVGGGVREGGDCFFKRFRTRKGRIIVGGKTRRELQNWVGKRDRGGREKD